MVDTKWELRKQHDISSLVSTGLSPITLNLLKNRGLNTIEEIENFIEPDLSDLHNPFLLKGMKETVDRIKKSIDNSESIFIFGDFDADGITSTSILVKLFRDKLNYPVEYYLPDRHKEGYGLSKSALDVVKMLGADLILTVDCGISAIEEVEYCKSLSMDIIISDHHKPQDKLPNCIIVNPKQSDCEYPNKNLAGCGVAFKIACALYPNLYNELDFEEYLNIVAFGSIADVVPLKDENRVIAYYGCRNMGDTTNIGLKKLIEKSDIQDRKITAGQVGFNLAPKINAVGRVSKADMGVELFTLKDESMIDYITDELIRLNEYRQSIESDMIEQAIEVIESDDELKNGKIIFIAKDDWNTGVIGITASKICEKYNKPTILMSINKKGICKGSGRSISNFSIFDPLMEAKPLLLGGGGHTVALGMSFKIEVLEEVKSIFKKHADKLTDDDLKRVIKVDSIIEDFDEILVNEIGLLEPFGIGNPTPVFMIVNKEVAEKRLLGKLQNHTKIKLIGMECLAFKTTMDDVKEFDEVSFVGNIGLNEFRGQTTRQLIVKDYKVLR